MLCMLSTDLVVIIEPSVIKEYQDILSSSNVKVVLVRESIEFGIFASYEDNRSVEHVIFRNHSIILDNLDGKTFVDVLSGFSRQTMVGIVREWLAYVYASMALLNAKQVGNDALRIYLINDPTGKRFESAFMVSKHSSRIMKSFARQM